MLTLFGGKLQKDLLPLGILEAFTVSLEELVRASLALDADEQRLLIVDALSKLGGALVEQPFGRPLEEQERRARFKLGIGRNQFTIAPLELTQMLTLFRRQLLKYAPAARILRHAGRSRIE